jgi:DNA-nicking Smr family endonuclease
LHDRLDRRIIILVIMDELQPVKIEIDGTLDLHTFMPREVKSLVLEYLQECQMKSILTVRIIHGKGTGSLRRTVHSVLKKMPIVDSFHLADEIAGSWGATIVHLTEQKTRKTIR